MGPAVLRRRTLVTTQTIGTVIMAHWAEYHHLAIFLRALVGRLCQAKLLPFLVVLLWRWISVRRDTVEEALRSDRLHAMIFWQWCHVAVSLASLPWDESEDRVEEIKVYVEGQEWQDWLNFRWQLSWLHSELHRFNKWRRCCGRWGLLGSSSCWV